MRWAMKQYKNRLFMTSAFGMNGIVLLDIVKDIIPEIEIYFIDTSYHFKETLDTREYYLEKGFNILNITSEHDSHHRRLYDIDSDLCCHVNKVEPMNDLLEKKKNHLWITGLSRDQSTTRKDTPYFESSQRGSDKLNPLIAWTEEEVRFYIRDNNLKYNPLNDQGYGSIGCQPCTTKIEPGENLRAGRWRGSDKLECGLHGKCNN